MAQMMFFLFHLVVSEPHLGILDFWDISFVSRDDDDRIECGSSDFPFSFKKRL